MSGPSVGSSFLFCRSGHSAQARKFAAEARKPGWASAWKIRRQPGQPARHAAGQATRHLLRELGELLRLGHAAAHPEQIAQRTHAATLAAPAPHGLHHVGHGPVHLEHPVVVRALGAGSGRDALFAGGFEDVGQAALLGRHRIDDRHLPLDHAIVEIGAGDLVFHLGDARDHAHEPGYAADLLHLLELIAQIGEVERALTHLFGDALRPFGVDRGRGLLDQRDDVAHAEDSVGDARRWKVLERFKHLAGADQLDRLDRHHRLPSAESGSMAAGRRVSSDAIITLRLDASASRLASFAAVVVLPEPCSPTSMIGIGAGALRSTPSLAPPKVAISSSWTSFTTIWPGVTDLTTSTPTARSRMRSTKARATSRATSASSNARRIWRSAASTSAWLSAPRPVSRSRMLPSRSERLSNIRIPGALTGGPRPPVITTGRSRIISTGCASSIPTACRR